MHTKLIVLAVVLVVAIAGGVWWRTQAQHVVVSASPSPSVAPTTPLADDAIILDAPLPGATVRSPLTVRGKARGTWFFEASFPLILTDWDGRIIAQVPAQAKGDWMTTDWVPFEATLTFTVDTTVSNRGALTLRKDNPSGDPKRDEHREVTIFFAK
jgi:hypothetical protein